MDKLTTISCVCAEKSNCHLILTTVYHSIRRGNKGSGIVNAKRSSIRDKKTTVSTFAIEEVSK